MQSYVIFQWSVKLRKKTAKTEMTELVSMITESPNSERVCLKLAELLNVRRSEVALLRLEKGLLRFVFPVSCEQRGCCR